MSGHEPVPLSLLRLSQPPVSPPDLEPAWSLTLAFLLHCEGGLHLHLLALQLVLCLWLTSHPVFVGNIANVQAPSRRTRVRPVFEGNIAIAQAPSRRTRGGPVFEGMIWIVPVRAPSRRAQSGRAATRRSATRREAARRAAARSLLAGRISAVRSVVTRVPAESRSVTVVLRPVHPAQVQGQVLAQAQVPSLEPIPTRPRSTRGRSTRLHCFYRFLVSS